MRGGPYDCWWVCEWFDTGTIFFLPFNAQIIFFSGHMYSWLFFFCRITCFVWAYGTYVNLSFFRWWSCTEIHLGTRILEGQLKITHLLSKFKWYTLKFSFNRRVWCACLRGTRANQTAILNESSDAERALQTEVVSGFFLGFSNFYLNFLFVSASRLYSGIETRKVIFL